MKILLPSQSKHALYESELIMLSRYFAIFIVVSFIFSCTEDKWMKHCESSDDCEDDRICICGSCTIFCNEDSECASDMTCFDPAELEVSPMCIYHETKQQGSGVCLYHCSWEEEIYCPYDNDRLFCTESEEVCMPYTVAAVREEGNTCSNVNSYTVTDLSGWGEGHEPVSLAVDSKNNAHMAFWDYKAGYRYATDIEESWDTELIFDGGLGNEHVYTAIGVDSNDFVHIIYQTSDSGGLEYTTNASGSWEKELIDPKGDVGGKQSLAVDKNDHVHIAYCIYDKEKGNKIVYADNSSGEWSTSVLPRNKGGRYGRPVSIALDSEGDVHIVDMMDEKLNYTTNASGKWNTEVTALSPENPSIRIAGNGIVYIIHDGGFYKKEDDIWLSQRLLDDYPVHDCSFAIDSRGSLHACMLIGEGELEDTFAEYLSNESGRWTSCTLGWGTGVSNSIATGPDDSVHIAYHDGERIIYAYKK